MAQITSRAELEEWLKDKPTDWAQVIAARAALRVLPYPFAKTISTTWVNDFALNLIRTVFISWVIANFPTHDVSTTLADHAASANRASKAADRAGAPRAADAADSAVDALYAADANFAAGAAADAAGAAGASARSAVWTSISQDCAWLTAEYDSASASSRLSCVALWLAGDGWTGAWVNTARRLVALNQSYSVWIEWYDRRLQGHDAAFDIPGDIDRAEDKAILARLADAANEDFWDKGATYVNTTLQRWIDEARERVRPDETPDEPPPPPSEAIRAVAAEIASPTITLANNKLDVVTNAAFDGQTDTANLDEAIAILRAVVAALLGGLPGNAPRSFAANLTIYDSELAKRDAKPFLGVLVRMEKSVSAGFHAEPELFDAGVATNFESYFDAHQEFMTHYRRNEEREAKIAQFKIDDAAAFGTALTGPVDEVAKEVEALAEQGLVTEGYAQAVKEQQEINTQIALYSSSLPTPSGEPTAKERHILQTVGFYERSLAVASNATTVAKPLIEFIRLLKEAIEALLKFFV